VRFKYAKLIIREVTPLTLRDAEFSSTKIVRGARKGYAKIAFLDELGGASA
jgi:hypothetical protein